MRTVISGVVLLVAVAIVSAEPIENPEFANWSKFKVGSSVTLKTTSKIKQVTTEVKSTTRLLEVGKDKLVLETDTVSVVNGMEFKAPGMKRDVAKTIDVPKPKDADKKAKVEKPEGTTEEGTETLKISGTDVKAKWYKYKTKAAGTEVIGQTWMSEDVPGQVVKMVFTSGDVTTSTELIELKKP